MWILLSLSIIIGAPITDPTWQLQSASDKVEQGILDEFGPKGARLGTGKLVAAGEWTTLTRTDLPLPPQPTAPQLVFANGDCLVGSWQAGDGDVLLFQPKSSTKADVLRFPTSALAVLWCKRRSEAEPDWVRSKRSRDLIQWTNGDTLLGSISKLESTRWQYIVGQNTQNIKPEQVLALAFNPDLVRIRKPKSPYYRVILRDGSRLSCSSVLFDGRVWALTTLYKEICTIALADLVQVSVERGHAVPISELQPHFAYTSFDGEQQTMSVDRNAQGGYLTINKPVGPSHYDRGLAVPAGSTLVYPLEGKYSRFEATFGMDSQLAALGSAQLHVYLDGKALELRDGGKLTFTHSMQLQLDVRGVKELKVHVARREGGAVQAYVNIVEGRLYPER